MAGNLGSCTLRRKRRMADPLQVYDALPAPLRHWLAEASLPWSPISAKRIWARALAQGLSEDEALDCLRRAEAATLARDRFACISVQEMGSTRPTA
ncbi:MAG: DUF6525 family protein [Pseudomonadota bacterium]